MVIVVPSGIHGSGGFGVGVAEGVGVALGVSEAGGVELGVADASVDTPSGLEVGASFRLKYTPVNDITSTPLRTQGIHRVLRRAPPLIRVILSPLSWLN